MSLEKNHISYLIIFKRIVILMHNQLQLRSKKSKLTLKISFSFYKDIIVITISIESINQPN